MVIIGKLLKIYSVKLIIYKATVCSLYNVQAMSGRWVEPADEKVLGLETQYGSYCRLRLGSVRNVCTVWMNVAVRLHKGEVHMGGLLVICIIIKHIFVDRFKLLDFCAISIFYSVMFDKVWKEFCVGVIVSPG